MRNKLEPWQQSLINKITPNVHEMVYQLDAAMHTMNKYQLRTRLALTQYPQNIKDFEKNASQVVNTINAVTHYANAEQKMASLHLLKAGKGSS